MPVARHSRNTADLPVLPSKPGESKQQWVYRQIAGAIEGGLLRPGDSVPSTRTLAARWATSRGVVELAFEQLGAEGYLRASVGKGTKVSDSLPDRFLRAETSPGVSAGPASSSDREVEAQGRVAAANPVQAGRPFIARLPDVNGFDLPGWRESLSRAARRLDPELMGHADPQGLPALRAEICRHLAVSRGIRCSPEEVVVVTGIRHAIDLCVQVAIPGHATVAVEDPGYAGVETILRLRGRGMCPIPLDDAGIDVEQLHASDASMAYVTLAHQAPTGVVMSPGRRAELLAWAAERRAWVLEDDYDSDFSYETAPLPALKSQDAGGRVIFCGSFNKSLFPGLRIGYVVAPTSLVAALAEARAATGRANPVLEQLALVEFMRSGALLRHLKKARVAYKARRDIVLQELRSAGWKDSDVQGAHAGFHFVLRLPVDVDEAQLCERAKAAGIAVQGIGAFRRSETRRMSPAIVIGYTALTDAQAKWSARELARILRTAIPTVP
jgi:GntR family transcriptional regulator/MocR family aminotransferase